MEQRLETKQTVTVTKDRVFSYGLVVALCTIWGLAFVAIRRAGFELSPVNLTILRWLIASAGFLILAPFGWTNPGSPSDGQFGHYRLGVIIGIHPIPCCETGRTWWG